MFIKHKEPTMAIMIEKIVRRAPEGIPHHKLAATHRDMDEAEFEALKASIEEIGQINPVTTYKGKLVDGRHRQRALIELGVHDMKVKELPNNMTLKDVEEEVIGSENRRTDTPAQKTIRAYLWYKQNQHEATYERTALKFGVNRSEISRAKRVEDELGSKRLNELYHRGYLIYGDKTYTNLRSLINMMNTKEKKQPEREPINDDMVAGRDHLRAMFDKGDIAGIAYLESVAKSFRIRDV